MKMDYRIVFSDLDGTLLDGQSAIPPATAEGIHILEARGIPFVPVSARPPLGIFQVTENVLSPRFFVASGGALILDETGEPFHSYTIAPQTALAVKALCRRSFPGVTATICETDNWMAESMEDPWVRMETGIGGFSPKIVDIDSYLEAGGSPHKFLFMGEAPELSRFEEEVRRLHPDLSVAKSNDCYLEVMDGEASKSKAMLRLCERLGISPRQAVAFGDNYNDVDMLEAAGLGVAMKNAPAAVQARADRITATNREQGLLQVLEELFGLGAPCPQGMM